MPRSAITRRLAIAACAAACGALATLAVAQDADGPDGLKQRALDLVNEARSEAGLSELSLDPVLNEAAQGHASDMAERNYYAHVAPDGQTPQDRYLAAGGSEWALSGENIARCSGCTPPPDAERVAAFHEGWMQSPEHRDNILSDGFDSFGFGIAGEADDIYAVQTFSGSGSRGEAASLGADEVARVALDEINDRRRAAGLAPLEASDALDVAAGRVLEARLADEDLPEDIFGLLPDGSTGWTSLAIRSASRGASGGSLSRDDVAAFVEGWAAQGAEATLGGDRATMLGFAATAREDGRSIAVALFGGRD